MKSTQRLPACSILRGLVFAAAALLALPVQAQHFHNSRPPVSILKLPAPFHRLGTFGDFDGDQRADFVLADALPIQHGTYRYRIGVHLSTLRSSAFDLETGIAGGLHVSAQDVDGDRDIDLVISGGFGRQPIGVWVNDGQGAFSPASVAAYSNSIWQQNARFFEPPESRLGQAVPIASSVGSAIEPSMLALPTPVAMLRLRCSQGVRPQWLVHLFRPLRAPPVF